MIARTFTSGPTFEPDIFANGTRNLQLARLVAMMPSPQSSRLYRAQVRLIKRRSTEQPTARSLASVRDPAYPNPPHLKLREVAGGTIEALFASKMRGRVVAPSNRPSARARLEIGNVKHPLLLYLSFSALPVVHARVCLLYHAFLALNMLGMAILRIASRFVLTSIFFLSQVFLLSLCGTLKPRPWKA